MAGPLEGIKVIEMKGLGPGPYAGMLLADMGASVTVVERASKTLGIAIPADKDIHSRGKQSIAIDVKHPDGLSVLLNLIQQSDLFFECYRPGVAERLGFGPEVCFKTNPKLIYGRLTGWGQTGPLSSRAGHDINYIALSGALAAIGPADNPMPPLNLLGDYAGGSLFLVMGMLAAHIQAQSTGQGQVVDAAIVDGASSLMSLFYGLQKLGAWNTHRQSNLLDGGAPHYRVYETKDQKFVSVGALEPQFFATLAQKLCLNFDGEPTDPKNWSRLQQALSDTFKTRTRDEWCDLLEREDACFAPVLDLQEAPKHPHNQDRGAFFEIDGVTQPGLAPRFSRTPPSQPKKPVGEGQGTEEVLLQAGYSPESIAKLRASGVLT